MTLRIWRRVHVMPGVTVNLGRTGASMSLGARGAHVTVGRQSRVTVGVPGSGVYVTQRVHVSGRSCPPNTCHASAQPHRSVHLGRALWQGALLGFGIGRALSGGGRRRRR